MTYRKPSFHIRKPSLRGRIAARTSLKRMIRAKVRVPRGMGILTNPKRAIYNRAYKRRTLDIFKVVGALFK